MVRTRIAPSPTGEDIHIGNLYTALINFAYAKKNQGKFIIRIEDTDRERYRSGAEEKILTTIKAYGLMYDEGPDKGGPYAPYRQSERLAIYKKYAEELVQKGRAYYCFCTKERLSEIRKKQQEQKQIPRYDKYCLNNVQNAQERIGKDEKFVIRLNVLPDKKVWFEDVVRGRIEFDSSQIDDQVLLKSDGYPTYHLGVVVDDYIMKISHVIRAEEWISSTPKHVLLYESFGWKMPVFAHLPILRNPDKSKLSKRKNPVWASWYLEQGYLSEAILNYLALMGWSHPEEKEIFTLEEFIHVFDLKDLKAVGPVFDITKLGWMNGIYIREKLSDEELIVRLVEFYKDDNEVKSILEGNQTTLGLLVGLAKTRMKTLKDFKDLVVQQINMNDYSNEEKELAEKLYALLDTIQNWKTETILDTLKKFCQENSLTMKTLYKLFTGKPQGLPLPETLQSLGKEATLGRLEIFK